ncbi:hypothetical protein M422DRAFT_49154 [Sphaerobolus stellatus SS14]|uniref:Fe2OG dioxygenase domain-containing protein n=1 Tax=Sphaerobolus stellatus (strain SS14) TaxID=990650 RepID=A0A0C9UB94_SPHS4|nr:hypothetical protein M422DRAFT_49154 [Sphaerobolus stellatus SS14]
MTKQKRMFLFLSSQPPYNNLVISRRLRTCPHGQDNKTVYDDSYRLAKEMPHKDYALSWDIGNQKDYFEAISAMTSNESDGVKAEPYKFNAYTQKSFFKAHRNTPNLKNHQQVGTVIICLPSVFTGGSLRISHKGCDQIIDWTEAASDFKEENIIHWAFLFSDVEHEVLPVTYVIFSVPSAQTSINVDAPQVPLYFDLKGKLEGNIAISLTHAYPMQTMSPYRFERSLKGEDALLHQIAEALGISSSLRRTYRAEVENREDVRDYAYEDEFSEVWTNSQWCSLHLILSIQTTTDNGTLSLAKALNSIGLTSAPISRKISSGFDGHVRKASVGAMLGMAMKLHLMHGGLVLILHVPSYGRGYRSTEELDSDSEMNPESESAKNGKPKAIVIDDEKFGSDED